VSRRQTWGRDARSDADEIQVLVRCQDSRIIGAGVQAGKLTITRIFSPPHAINVRLSNDFTTSESGPMGPYRCPNHKQDHWVDVARLRKEIYRLTRKA
jgi:hypothetical protein